jgi:lipopolysaccharide/colanic/teichoic acid biosynthesis glycosyltransferase
MKWKFCNKECYEVSEKQKKEALEYEENLIKNKSVRKGPLYKIKNDPRKTKIGKFIEKYSIDEFPQFFNVLV